MFLLIREENLVFYCQDLKGFSQTYVEGTHITNCGHKMN